jgi:hypothetical protein
LISNSRVWPLRLFSKLTTATRSAIGVPSCSPTAAGIFAAEAAAFSLAVFAGFSAGFVLDGLHAANAAAPPAIQTSRA